MLLGRKSVDEHNLGSNSIAPLDVTDVIPLDPSWRDGKLKELGQILCGQSLLFLTLFGALQFVVGIALDKFDQISLLTLLWTVDLNLAFALF